MDSNARQGEPPPYVYDWPVCWLAQGWTGWLCMHKVWQQNEQSRSPGIGTL
jgi:hypothetical protein